MLTSVALALGFVHGLGADHLMAIAALTVGSRSSSIESTLHPVRVAIRFACGHALLLVLGGAAALALGWTIPVVVERAGEVVGGTLLVVLGTAGLWAAWSGRVYGHAHGAPSPAPWHLHVGQPDRHPSLMAHGSVGFILGAVFAVSSLRALVLLAPFGHGLAGPASSLGLLLWLIGAFAVGIIAAMSLFGIVLARVMSAAGMARLSRASGATIGLASITLGTYWLASRF